jgi:DNA-binding CsgD family transcriptional regulator
MYLPEIHHLAVRGYEPGRAGQAGQGWKAMRGDIAARAEREVVRLTHLGLDWPTLSWRAGEALRAAMPFDHACWHTVDPVSLLLSGVAKDNLDDEARLPYHEYAVTDVNQWVALARSARPVGILAEATADAPGTSPRYRELLRPRGISDEIRAAFVADGTCWGACGIYRDAGRPGFTPAEAGLVLRAGRHLADGYRRALLLASPPGITGQGAGLVLFDHHGAPESADPVAAGYLDGVVDRMPRRGDAVPHVVRAVAERARAAVHDADLAGPVTARARVRTRDGRWLVLHGTHVSGPAGSQLAVLVEPATPAELWPVIASVYRLSAREREIVLLCLRGASTTQIAGKLSISPHTVQDHLKSVFDKAGVRSRRELVARVFHDHYWDPVAHGRAPHPRGGFTSLAS